MSKVREYENFHIVLWLLKDSFWLMEWKLVGVLVIVPVITVAFYITWLDRKSQTSLFHNLAIICWLCGDSIWMIGDFFLNSRLKLLPASFFAAGLVFLVIYYFGILPMRKYQQAKTKRR
jgi:quinol-cytochrome oxidoreductase complex cytochrome b subunit